MTKLINIGFGNLVSASKIVAIVSPDSAPIRRMVQEAKGHIIDATCGRRTRAVIFAEGGQMILSAVLPETISSRLKEMGENDNDEQQG